MLDKTSNSFSGLFLSAGIMHERHATPNLKSTDILISGYLD